MVGVYFRVERRGLPHRRSRIGKRPRCSPTTTPQPQKDSLPASQDASRNIVPKRTRNRPVRPVFVSETLDSHALQHVARFKDRVPGCVDRYIQPFDASAHLRMFTKLWSNMWSKANRRLGPRVQRS
jgi:hypothetical protein